MPDNMSDYLESALLNHVFRSTTYTAPTDIYLALCSGIPQDSDTGALTAREIPNAGSYARQKIGPGTSYWDAPVTTGASGYILNTSGITFPTASADWGWVSGLAIVDSATYGEGNLIMFGPATTAKFIGNGDTATVPSGQIRVSFS